MLTQLCQAHHYMSIQCSTQDVQTTEKQPWLQLYMRLHPRCSHNYKIQISKSLWNVPIKEITQLCNAPVFRFQSLGTSPRINQHESIDFKLSPKSSKSQKSLNISKIWAEIKSVHLILGPKRQTATTALKFYEMFHLRCSHNLWNTQHYNSIKCST